MNYKKIFTNRAFRIKLLQTLSFVPDKMIIKLQYRIKTGHRLNLKSPQRFTEKLQWYKLYYRNPLMKQCADKYEVRKYIEQCGLKCILNELYGVYNTPDEIDFDRLPNSFVLKDTLGGGGNSVIIVSDKNLIDRKLIKNIMWNWVNEPIKKHPGREWIYDGRKHRIIVEKYIDSDSNECGLIDYKIFVIQGKAEYLYVMAERDIGKTVRVGIYNADYVQLDVYLADKKPLKRNLLKPKNFENMLYIAEKLAYPFPEARVDFYNVNGVIIFGEITFFDASGYTRYEPDDFDFILGKKFQMPLDKV